jgi:hypothetical protein
MDISPDRIEFEHQTNLTFYREFQTSRRAAAFWKTEQLKLTERVANGYTIRLYINGAIVHTLTPSNTRTVVSR